MLSQIDNRETHKKLEEKEREGDEKYIIAACLSKYSGLLTLRMEVICYSEKSALSEGSRVPRAYCITGGDIYRPRKIESCSGNANPQKQARH
jgi:hypothetical protein